MESKTVQLGSTRYHYLEWVNEGKPKLLLIHGLKVEAHCWLSVVEHLKQRFHIYSLDMKGHGQSQDGSGHDPDYSLDQVSRELQELYQVVIKQPFHIAGYSLGGQFAMHFAAQYPEALESLILLDTAPEVSLLGIFFLVIKGAAKNRAYASREELVAAFAKKGHQDIGRYMAEYAVRENSGGRIEYRFDEPNIAPKSSGEYKQRVRQLWHDLAAVKVRAVFLKAEKSQVVSRKIAARMRQTLPGLEQVTISGVGHEMVFSAPAVVAEAVAAAASQDKASSMAGATA